MATGSGKTFTAVTAIYRLVKFAEVPRRQHRRGHRSMAQLDADAGHEDVDRHRFDHVVVGTDVEGGDDPVVVVVAGHDDDRCAGPHVEPPAQLDAVDVREPEIEEDDVVVRCVDSPARRVPVGDRGDGEARAQ